MVGCRNRLCRPVMVRRRLHKRVARAAAISIVTLVLALGAAWVAPRASGAVAVWLRTPAVRARTMALPGGLEVGGARATAQGSSVKGVVPGLSASPVSLARVPQVVTLSAGMRFTMVGVTCRPPSRRGGVTVRLRTSVDGHSWSRWYVADLEVAQDGASSASRAFTEPLWTGYGRYVQVAAFADARAGTARGARTAVRLRGVQVVALNSTEDADRAAIVVGVVRRTIATIAGWHFAAPARAMTRKPNIVTRAQWGANESLRSGSPSTAPVKVAFVHHTVSGNRYTRAQAPAIVRGIYYYHTKALHWSDIGYNFLVDRYGTVYEGRYGGVTKGVIGAQVLGFNTGSTGVSMIGTFSDVKPPAVAVRALEKLLAWKLDINHVNPLGKGTLVCRYGQKFKTGQHVVFPAIAGHRQANYTECPGTKLYRLLPSIRAAVARIGQPKIYALRVSSAYISPNGDGVHDKTTAKFTTSETANWSLEVRDGTGAVVRTFSGRGTAVAVTWAGTDDDGKTLPDGAYTLVAAARSSHGTAREAKRTVHLDTTPPSITSVGISPNPFSPNGDGYADKVRVRFVPSEAGKATVAVFTPSGDLLRTLVSQRAVTAAARTVTWGGFVSQGGKLVQAPEGPLDVVITLLDRAGNAVTTTRSVVVDRTIGFPQVVPRYCSPNGDGVKDSATVRFELTRAADVSLDIVEGGTVVRSVTGGSLAKGSRAIAWDGKLGDDSYPASGSYRARLTAVGSLGTSVVSESFTVDRYRPRLSAPSAVAVARGKVARVRYTVRDPYSPTVKVVVTVMNSRGTTLATLNCGWVKQKTSHVVSWKPPRRGTYRLTFAAVDRAGNAQNARRTTSLTAR
jgi:flagellar hook assembly protein FlgD